MMEGDSLLAHQRYRLQNEWETAECINIKKLCKGAHDSTRKTLTSGGMDKEYHPTKFGNRPVPKKKYTHAILEAYLY